MVGVQAGAQALHVAQALAGVQAAGAQALTGVRAVVGADAQALHGVRALVVAQSASLLAEARVEATKARLS